jgi:Tol biopolymer transport system component
MVMSDASFQLATSAADGSGLRVLTSVAGTAMTPDWAPDGAWLVYAQNEHLWRIDADGADARLIGDSNEIDWEPRVSPDGTKVVFERGNVTELRYEIWIRDLATGHERRLLDADVRSLEHPDWSRDGHSVIYNTLDDPSGHEVQQIERVSADDPTATPEVLAGDPAHFAYKPTYSPDGRTILFGLDGKVCVMAADGSNLRVLLDVSGVEFNHFAWGPRPTPVAWGARFG